MAFHIPQWSVSLVQHAILKLHYAWGRVLVTATTLH